MTKKAQVAIRPEETIQGDKMIELALKQNASVETMERILAMRKELKAEFAKEEFLRAMTEFQAGCPVIEKKKAGGKTKGGQVAYKYAPLDSIIEQVRDVIAQHQFSYTFKQENNGTAVKVTCIVSHSAGHSEESTMETGLATKTGIMSGPQQIASTVTFNKRYAFCNAFGIMTGDEDNDANYIPPATAPTPTKVVPIAEEVIAQYSKLLKSVSTINELQRVWLSIPPKAKIRLTADKNEMKAKLTPEPAEIVAEAFGGEIIDDNPLDGEIKPTDSPVARKMKAGIKSVKI